MGASPRFLGVQARAPGRLWSLLCPWGRRGDSGVAGRKKGHRGFGTDTERDTSAMGLGAWCWTSQSLSLGDKGGESWRGEGARRGQGCFPSEFKVAFYSFLTETSYGKTGAGVFPIVVHYVAGAFILISVLILPISLAYFGCCLSLSNSVS